MPKREIVLVAEDSSEDAFILKRAFEKANIQVPMVFVKDGQEAVNYLSGKDQFADRSAHPFPRLLLLDLKMPRMDGFDVLAWLQSHPELRRLLVTVLTSSAERSDVNRAYDLGANSYLVKPSSSDDLVSLVKRLHAYWLEINHPPQISGSV